MYTADAATAILTVLLKGEPGQAYNAANEDTYCSIAQMAEMVAKQGGVKVRYKLTDIKSMGYGSVLYMNLVTNKIKLLGWNAKKDLKTCFGVLIYDVKHFRKLNF